MAQGVTAKGADIRIAWPLPRQGVQRQVSEEGAPKDSLFDALNVRLRRGELQARPGLGELNSAVLGSRPTGASMYRDSSGNRFAVVGGRTTMHRWNGTNFATITGTAPAGAVDNLFRFSTLRVGSDTFILGVNGQIVVQQWDGSGNFADVSGSPLTNARDIITAFDRIILCADQEVRWGDPVSVTSWPALNSRLFMESPDEIVGLEPLGMMNLAVLKEKSIWVGTASGVGSSAFAFRWDFRGWYEGPASAAAKVNINGRIYYMTPQGRIGMFDGVRHEWVADGVWPVIQDDIGTNQDAMNQAWAVYDPLNNDIYFTYARSGDADELTGMCLLSLPSPKHGLPNHAAFPGRWLFAVSAGTVFRQATLLDQVLVLRSTAADERSFTLTGNQDDGSNFDVEARTHLQPVTPLMDVHRVQSVEPFFRRAAGFGTVDVQVATSNVLDVAGGTLGAATREDLTVAPVKGIVGAFATGRFLGLRFTGTSNNTFRYMGAVIRAREENPLPTRAPREA